MSMTYGEMKKKLAKVRRERDRLYADNLKMLQVIEKLERKIGEKGYGVRESRIRDDQETRSV